MRRRLSIVIGVTALLSLSACGESETATEDAKPASRQSVAQKPDLPKPDYLLERHGYDCMQAECTFRKTPKKYRVEEFGKSIPDWIDLAQGMSTKGLRGAIQKDFKGRKSAGMGNTTTRNIMYDFIHLRPHLNIKTPEYEIYFTYGMDGKLIDWGGRVRCMPVTATTPWQITPC